MWFTLLVVLDLFLFLWLPVVILGWPLWVAATLVFAYYALWLPRHWPALRALGLWDWIRDRHFGLRFEGPGKEFAFLSAKGKERYVLALHPHTLFAVSLTLFFTLNKRFLRFRSVGTSLLFSLPLVREATVWAGTIPAHETEMRRALLDDETIRGLMMCPGGMREVGMQGDAIRQRTGFLRVAAQTKAYVVPIWCPQERDSYRIWCPLGDFFLDRLLLYPWPVLSWGLWWLPFFPRAPASGTTRVFVGRPFRPDPADIPGAKAVFYQRIEELKELAQTT